MAATVNGGRYVGVGCDHVCARVYMVDPCSVGLARAVVVMLSPLRRFLTSVTYPSLVFFFCFGGAVLLWARGLLTATPIHSMALFWSSLGGCCGCTGAGSGWKNFVILASGGPRVIVAFIFFQSGHLQWAFCAWLLVSVVVDGRHPPQSRQGCIDQRGRAWPHCRRQMAPGAWVVVQYPPQRVWGPFGSGRVSLALKVVNACRASCMAVTLDWWSLPVGWVAKMGWAPNAVGALSIASADMVGGCGGGAGIVSGEGAGCRQVGF